MSATKVIVDKSKLDTLNDTISSKLGTSVNRTLDEMDAAVTAIPTGTPLPALTDPASASDILDGKEAILPDANNQPVAVTGTLVPPVDTGANGQCRKVIARTATEYADTEITQIGRYGLAYNSGLVKLSLPNVKSVGLYAFANCPNLTGIIDLSSWDTVYANEGAVFNGSLTKTIVLKTKRINQMFNGALCEHAWLPLSLTTAGNYQFYGTISIRRTVQFDLAQNISFAYCNGGNDNFVALILRNQTLTTLNNAGNLTYNSNFKIYVPTSLVNDYKGATNWTTYASLIVGIDEDTTATVGQTFIPTYTATDIVSWDMVELQSYSVGTVDSATGTITPTHDGRLLIRGLDASDNIVHVTYLQIGTGFDEEANLA